jgi:four helix bundle protein
MSDGIKSYHDLKVWQLGMDLTERIYVITASFPSQEMYGLTSQLRRAASSIPANIAEGFGRDSIREYLHHISIAIGSLCEVETFLQLAMRLRYGDESVFQSLIDAYNEEGRMLRGLQKSLKARLKQSSS